MIFRDRARVLFDRDFVEADGESPNPARDASAIFFLLISFANVVNLLLVRTSEGERESAVLCAL